MNATSSNAVFNDLGGLANLRGRANGGDAQGALKEAAKQFEAIFLNMMLKQMRESSFGDPLFDSSASDSYRSMFDQQLALNLSESGSLGISKLIERQLGGEVPAAADSGNPFKPFAFTAPVINKTIAPVINKAIEAATSAPIAAVINKAIDAITTAPVNSTPAEAKIASKQAAFSSVNDFVSRIWPHAEKAARELGIPTETLVSQAALETGWGKYMIKAEDGRSSNNLFGIKADQRWDGDLVSIKTTEYRDGVVQKERANFRAYDSLEQGFNDYVNFLKSNPRYIDALNSQGNARDYLVNLQEAGYATDPAYANKIQSIMQGETLEVARAKLNI